VAHISDLLGYVGIFQAEESQGECPAQATEELALSSVLKRHNFSCAVQVLCFCESEPSLQAAEKVGFWVELAPLGGASVQAPFIFVIPRRL
jgi:hypothetical protein